MKQHDVANNRAVEHIGDGGTTVGNAARSKSVVCGLSVLMRTLCSFKCSGGTHDGASLEVQPASTYM